MKVFFSLLLLVFCSLTPSYSVTTYLQGQFSDKNLALHLQLRIDQQAYNGIKKQHEIALNGQEAFSTAFDIDYPQFVKIIYARNELLVFAEPGDTIDITIDPNNFVYNSTLSGVNGIKNRILKHYYKNNNSAHRKSERLQFKYVNFWYHTNTTIDEWMRTLSGEEFLLKMTSRKDRWQKYLLDQERDHPEAFSKKLGNYFGAEILYDWAYFMLVYGTTYSNRHNLPNDYLAFLESVPLTRGTLISPRYQKYLMARMNHQFIQQYGAQGTFDQRYSFGQEQLGLPEQSYYLAELLIQQLKKREEPAFIDKYYTFINENPIVPYSEKLSRKFNRLIYLSKGSEAPSFALPDSSNATQESNSLLGQPVLINFWASWCKPCISKFPDLKELEEKYMDKIQFVSINLDTSKESFRQSIERYDPPGLQLYAEPEIQSSTMADFGVKFLPGTLLLDGEWRFQITPDEFDKDQLDAYFEE